MTLLQERPVRASGTRAAARPVPAPSAAGRAAAAPTRRPRRSALPVAAQTPSGVLSGLTSVPFIVPIVGLVIAALGLTLYLSTSSAEDSYGLESARRTNQQLTDKRDDLKRAADSGDSAPELSDKAAKLGLVPAVNAPQLVIGADGKSKLVGSLDDESDGRRLGSLNPEPDPISTIDVSKVDDAGGLAGTPPPAETEPAEQTPAAQRRDGQTAAAASPAAPVAPDGDPAQTPAPNVLPEAAATPGRNPGSAR